MFPSILFLDIITEGRGCEALLLISKWMHKTDTSIVLVTRSLVTIKIKF